MPADGLPAALNQPTDQGHHGVPHSTGTLPSHRAHFEASSGVPGMAAGSAPVSTGAAPAAIGDGAGTGWSHPILFFPDGTASQGVVTITDGKGLKVTVSVRPLTGAVTVSQITRG